MSALAIPPTTTRTENHFSESIPDVDKKRLGDLWIKYEKILILRIKRWGKLDSGEIDELMGILAVKLTTERKKLWGDEREWLRAAKRATDDITSDFYQRLKTVGNRRMKKCHLFALRSNQPNPLDVACLNEQAEVVKRILYSLPPKEIGILMLVLIDGKSLKYVGQLCGLPKHTVRNMFDQFFEKVGKMFPESFGEANPSVGNMNSIHPKIVERIRIRRSHGTGLRELSELFGMSIGSVFRLCGDITPTAGSRCRGGFGGRIRFDSFTVEEIRKLRAQGTSVMALAKKYDASKSAIHKVVNRQGCYTN